MFEAFVLALAKEMPVSAVAQLVAEHDTRLSRVVRHYVGEAHGQQDWSRVEVVAIDETSTRKGHRYATVVVDLNAKKEQAARLLYMTPERSAGGVRLFVEAMPAHGATAKQVRLAAIKKSAGYQKEVKEHLPQARMVFDRFHVMQLAGRAVDEVREELRSRLPAFRRLAQTIKDHWEGILAYDPHRITSAAIESINSIIKPARRRARGFRNFANLKAICYWMAGDLNLKIPSAFTHP